MQNEYFELPQLKIKFRIRTLLIVLTVAAILAFVVKDRFRTYYGRFVIPAELSSFLYHGELEVDCSVSEMPQALDRVTFIPIEKLRISKFVLSTGEYYLNYDEPGQDPNAYYEFEGVDLLAKTEGYYPDGVLIWFPEFKQFGAHDGDHGIIRLFPPDKGWNEIQTELGKYVNAQWYPERVGNELLRPWADERCKSMKPKFHPR